MYVESYSSMESSGSTTFVGNSASDGGGVTAQSNSCINVSRNTIFGGNSAINSGGQIHVEQNSKVKIGGNMVTQLLTMVEGSVQDLVAM